MKLVRLLSNLIAFCTTGALLSGAAAGQDYTTYYSYIHRKEMALDWPGFYKDRTARTLELQKQLPTKLNVAYGTDPKQKLDLYFPAKTPHHAPILLFLHGGSFMEGDRAHYGYLAKAYAERGVISAIASYRLTTAGFHYPSQNDDTKLAIRWLHENAKSFGGDPDWIVVSGHSAGAVLAAAVGVDRAWMKDAHIPVSALKGVVGVSGRYRLGPDEKGFHDYVPTSADEDAASPILHIKGPVPPMVITAGDIEQTYYPPSVTFVETLKADGMQAELITQPGHNHQQAADSLGDPESPVFQATMALLKPAGAKAAK